MTESRNDQTRAKAPAREASAVTVKAIRLPKEARRVPLVLVDVERAGLRLTFAVARLRGGALDIRPPRGPDGIGDGVWLPTNERERIGNAIMAAVKADPAAARVLR